jgi:hypothetical protein
MFKVKVNEAFETYGLISFSIREEEGGYVKEGIFKTHLYIEEIDTLECDRFIITGINVISESFGSTDPFIVYYFSFDMFETYYEDFYYSEEELEEMYKKENE